MTKPYVTIRIYFVNLKCASTKEDFRNIVSNTEEVFIEHLKTHSVVKYIYSDDTFKLLEGEAPFSWELPDFFDFYVNGNYDIYIKTKGKLPFELVGKTKTTNWPKIITDLELLGYVKTFPTKSYLAVDERKFNFVEKPVDEALDVDFLGTEFAIEISEKILELWQRAKGFKVLSKSF